MQAASGQVGGGPLADPLPGSSTSSLSAEGVSGSKMLCLGCENSLLNAGMLPVREVAEKQMLLEKVCL